MHREGTGGRRNPPEKVSRSTDLSFRIERIRTYIV
jgi:hypothetical protein